MVSLISQPIAALSQQEFYHRHSSHTHSQEESHILCMNPWICAINATIQLVKVHKIQSHFVCGSHWNISINFDAYLTILSHKQLILFMFGMQLTFSTEKPMVM